jgi:RNA polymerase sigma factor (sigma-70 family)
MDRRTTAMGSRDTVPPEVLIAHAASLRALTLSLCGDEHAADDVMQDTFLRTLTAPPAERDRLGGWMRRVAEGFALKRRRAEDRRAQRERLYARERPEAVHETRSRAEVLQAVVGAVLSLEDPYRETILQRWFEGLTPSDIAARTRTSVATVNSRLQRAHALLRERLERKLDLKDDELRGALLGVFGLRAAQHTAALSTATLSSLWIAMASTTKILSAAAVAAVGLCTFLFCDGSRGELQPPLARETSEARAAVVAVPDPAQPPTARVATGMTEAIGAEPAEEAPKIAAGPYVFDLTIVAIDEIGRPRTGVVVNLAPAQCALNEMGQTHWDGAWHGTWRGFEPTIDAVLQLSSSFGGTPMRRVKLVAGAPQALRIGIEPPAGFQETSFAVSLLEVSEPNVTGSVSYGLKTSSGGPTFLTDDAGNGVFRDPGLLFEVPEPRVRVLANELMRIDLVARIEQDRWSSLLGKSVKATAPGDAPEPPPPATVTGFVRDERGEPIRGAIVSFLAQKDTFRRDVRTDANGQYDLGEVPAGPAEFFAGGGEHVIVHESLEIFAGDHRAISPIVAKAALARGRITNAAGEPLKHWYVEARDIVDDDFVGRAETDGEGRFAIALADRATVRLLGHPGTDSGIAGVERTKCLSKCVLTSRFFFANEEQQIVASGDLALTSIAIALEGDARLPFGDAEVRVWSDDSGEATLLSHRDGDPTAEGEQATTKVARYADRVLLAGGAAIECAVPGAGWRSLGHFTLGGAAALDLAPIALDAPAQLDALTDSTFKAELTLGLRAHGVQIQSYGHTVSDQPRPLLFPAGKFELAVACPTVMAETEMSAKYTDESSLRKAAVAKVSKRAIEATAGQDVEVKLAPR